MLFCSCTNAENKIADCHIADAVITEQVKGIISKKETSSALQDKAEEVETNYEQWGICLWRNKGNLIQTPLLVCSMTESTDTYICLKKR